MSVNCYDPLNIDLDTNPEASLHGLTISGVHRYIRFSANIVLVFKGKLDPLLEPAQGTAEPSDYKSDWTARRFSQGNSTSSELIGLEG